MTVRSLYQVEHVEEQKNSLHTSKKKKTKQKEKEI